MDVGMPRVTANDGERRCLFASLPGPKLLQLQWESFFMPEKATIDRAREDAEQGKSPSTQAGEFVREEFEHIREGKHGARSAKQAIAIGLSKARRSGVALPPPEAGHASKEIRAKAKQDYDRGQGRPPAKRSRATKPKRKGTVAAQPKATSRRSRKAPSASTS